MTDRRRSRRRLRRGGAERVPGGEDAEAAARRREIATKPASSLSASFVPAALPVEHGPRFRPDRRLEPTPLGRLALLGPGDPGPVLYRLDYYTGGFKSLRNRSANMDVLVAMGSSVAYLYSLGVLMIPTLGTMFTSNIGCDHHAHQTGEDLESRTKAAPAAPSAN